jgi:hypothetical protein
VQLSLDYAVRSRDAALARCTTVTSADFRERAAHFIVTYLGAHGETSSEDLTDACEKIAGLRPTDLRHFGPVFLRLIRTGKIEKCGQVARRRGHGSSGGNVYRLMVIPPAR